MVIWIGREKNETFCSSQILAWDIEHRRGACGGSYEGRGLGEVEKAYGAGHTRCESRIKVHNGYYNLYRESVEERKL